jgi:DNA (cytosine-5)-methyltransferase 1
MNDERPTHLDLFSGIGGFAIAAERCGWKTVAFCEREKFAQRVLRKHWPGVPIIDDIHDLDGREYRGVSLLTGGFPCQPFSQAGQQRGAADDRALWPEMLRVITEARPRFVVAENVAGIINLALDDVLSSLEAASYSVGAVIVPACAVDAKHRRDRVWILGADKRGLANPDGERLQRWSQAGDTSGGGAQRNEQLARRGETLANTKSEGGKRREPGNPGIDSQSTEELPRRSRSRNGTRQEWTTEPDVGRVAYGIPERSHRLRGLGNAIVPQVAEQVLMALIESER